MFYQAAIFDGHVRKDWKQDSTHIDHNLLDHL